MIRKSIILFAGCVIAYEEIRKSKYLNDGVLSNYKSSIQKNPSFVDFVNDIFSSSKSSSTSSSTANITGVKNPSSSNIDSNPKSDNQIEKTLQKWKEQLPQWSAVEDGLNHGIFIQIHLQQPTTKDSRELYTEAIRAAASNALLLQEKGYHSFTIGFSSDAWKYAVNSAAAEQDKSRLRDNLFDFSYSSFVDEASNGLFKKKSKNIHFPSTGGDIFLHIKGASLGECVNLSSQILQSLPSKSLESVDEECGFKSLKTPEAVHIPKVDIYGASISAASLGKVADRCETVLVPEIGGTYCLIQKWTYQTELRNHVHNDPELKKKVIGGNTNASEIYSPEAYKEKLQSAPKNSHLSKVLLLDPQEKPLAIYTQALSYGRPYGVNNGVLFCAYTKDPFTFGFMLDRMAGNDGSGADPVFSYSKCNTGNIYYCPSLKELKSISFPEKI